MTRWDYFPMARGPIAPGPGIQGGWQITSYFGGRIDPITGVPGSHGGQDLAYWGCGGSALFAPSAGTLAQGWDPSGGGNWSGITLDDGSYVGLGHAQSFAPGDPYRRVYAGELIAYCDSTGGSTGDHVHVAYRPAGSWSYADPYDLLEDSQHRIVGSAPPPNEEDDMNRDDTRLEFTGQTAKSVRELYVQWFGTDNRRYHTLVIHDLRTQIHWAVFGPFKWRIPPGYEGWWHQRPDVLQIAGDGEDWPTAAVDSTVDVATMMGGAALEQFMRDMPPAPPNVPLLSEE